LKRRKAASKYSFSRTRTLGIQTSKVGDGRRFGDRGAHSKVRTHKRQKYARFRHRKLL
jgi:hypothetical protein